mgnify:CR=1 FL=1|tara:strand:+ start:40453 stop:41655 length:1203 start_codon:yes stop_codon:yes gene_type:complete
MSDNCYWVGEVFCIESCSAAPSSLFLETGALRSPAFTSPASGYGGSVAISGDTAVVGSNNEINYGRGAVYVYVETGGSWNQQQVLSASDGANYDRLGDSVAISGEYLIAGAGGDDDNGSSSGSAYVFVRSGTSWTEQQKLLASDGAGSDGFGRRVAISGVYALVGASGDDDDGSQSGSAYVFKRSGSSWSQTAKLTASDADASFLFGDALDLHGDDAIIGSFGNSSFGSDSGSAYVFTRSGESWIEQQKLTASDAEADARFGGSVVIRGDYAIVSSNSGAYVFHRTGGVWTEQFKFIPDPEIPGQMILGTSVALSEDGSLAAIGGGTIDMDTFTFTGAMYIYQRTGSTWDYVETVSPSNGDTMDNFGLDSEFYDDHLIVGSFADMDLGQGAGGANIFTKQ